LHVSSNNTYSKRKTINGRVCILEEAIKPHFALIKASIADKNGNLYFKKSTGNFNYDMAMAGKITIAEVEKYYVGE